MAEAQHNQAADAESQGGAPGLGERLAAWGDRFAAFTVDVIYDRRRDRKARLWAAILTVLSYVFLGLSTLRRLLYRWGILRASHLGCLVVVVGNLTVGGTGKTPVVERLARNLQRKGRKVAILSRGYKSRKEPGWRKAWRLLTHTPPAPPRVVSDGETVFFDSEVAGDEPYMLAKNLPGVIVITDKDRVKAGQYAIRKYGADTLILDDGFQYFQLKDHLQLLLVDKSNPFGNGHVLPRGILREPVSQLRRASYVFLTKSDGVADAQLEAQIRRHRPGTELIECRHAPQYLQSVNGEAQAALEALAGKRVGALSGIAVPESFEQFLKEYGAVDIVPYRFLDHHRFTAHELARLAEQVKAAGLDYLVTTEKDAVRIPPNFQPGVPFYFLRVEIRVLSGVDDFEAAVNRICFPRHDVEDGRWRSGLTQVPFK